MESIVDLHSTTVTPTEAEDGNTSTRTESPPTNTNIDALPEELLSDILVRDAAEDLQERARLVSVCKRWCRTIHGRAFVAAHLQRSRYGLLLSRGVGCKPNFVAATHGNSGGGIEVSKLSYKLESLIPASCNGLIMGIHGTGKPNFYFIANPLTKACFDLPPIPDTMCGSKLWVNRCGIAYAPASMVYKVVVTYCPNYNNAMFAQCVILTVGVDDTWRHVPTEHLSYVANRILARDYLLITQGFMHWACRCDDSILTMNMETEVFAETPTLLECRGDPGSDRHWYLSTGRNLSVLAKCGYLSWEVWEMKGETGEWRKILLNFDLKAFGNHHALKGGYIKPIGWVEYPKVLIFCCGSSNCTCFVYNLDNDEVDSVKLPMSANTQCTVPVVHKNSLVCIS